MSLNYDTVRVLNEHMLVDRDLNLHNYATHNGEPLMAGVYLVIWRAESMVEEYGPYGPSARFIGPLEVSSDNPSSLYGQVLDCLAQRRADLEATAGKFGRTIC
jgi:hypothetical protein